ncbi:MAG TPA: hypothetical protein DIS98_13045 [Colwellia sp.]|nr:hypothetical protein [Colwellia sp.]|tara:strand:- start:4644 stop:6857 length:2214 start_codon:yes stop_codon:yes gene_type:complete
MSITVGSRLVSKRYKIDWLICHVRGDISYCAYYDLNLRAEEDRKNKNYRKPTIVSVSKMADQIRQKRLKVEQYNYPTIITQSDEWIAKELKRSTWLEKRDDKFREIEPITSRAMIDQYLYGDGVSTEISGLIETSELKHKDQFYRYLNRFVFFSCVKNGLLPFKLGNTGTNYQMGEDENKNAPKRGPNGKAKNKKIRSKARAVTKQDTKWIKKVAAYIKKNHPNFKYQFAYVLFIKNYLSYQVVRGEGADKQIIRIPYEETRRISYDQFRYHFKKIIGRADLLKMQVGELAFKKDHEDKQGKSFDGVMCANQRYEVDATVLDIYVRYPFDNSGRYSMGRPILYLVVDVYSTMIVGMYIGFDGPNWQGASMALANACLDKVTFAARYGLRITSKEWPANYIPREITIDNGNEYPNNLIRSVLKSEIGVETFNLAAVFRGDAKGVVERKFGVLNEKIHFLPGAMPQAPRRDEQHPSNQAELDYDDLMQEVIAEIIHHNQSADRTKRRNFFAISNNAGITPQDIFESSIREHAAKMRKTTEEDEAKVRWAFMPEEKATVRKDCVFYKGVEYHHPYFKKSNLYARARHHKSFPIIIKPVRDWVDNIWHKTDEGHYIKLEAKNINNENPLLSHHWETVLHLLDSENDLKHANRNNALISKLHWDSVTEASREEKRKELELIAPNRNKSIQIGIKDRKHTQKMIQTVENVVGLNETLSTTNTSNIDTSTTGYLDDNDEELYGD